ncbi:hypothetical protein M569_04511 [Genlisea aurea]|uniref:Polymerase nucleotidyl transferase domain-containing protein n=1 Tax=Genlisea aurea TaxID=192259 RepID=S8CSH9_9LAMI|nr:hypothetical protein M569_04511 [Genlisea aurea]
MGSLGHDRTARVSASSDLDLLDEECLSSAEEAAQRLLTFIHPTVESENMRRSVIDYVQRLVRSTLDCEIFPYGSVPLKTYLPDGDIDFTAFRCPNLDDSIAYDVYALILREEEEKKGEYRIREPQFIDAEVKLVKFILQDFVIDISFNQLGGLSTLCFLEQVDRLVGRNHLFKRSMILVKAWCYYESRILGSHHGLISTYALEILVLYVIDRFNSSLHGPLAVLHQFLCFYSRFDWEKYGVSLKGLICVSSLPAIVVMKPESRCGASIFDERFLDECREMYSVASSDAPFQAKHLNIVDPLNESNNLGRSVNRGSFFRIQSALRYGASRLGHVLSRPGDEIDGEINKFFASTLARHGTTRHHRDIDEICVGFEGLEVAKCSSSPADLTGDCDGQRWRPSSYSSSSSSSSEVVKSAVAVEFDPSRSSNEPQRTRGTGTYLPNPDDFYKRKFYQFRWGRRNRDAAMLRGRQIFRNGDERPGSNDSWCSSSNGILRISSFGSWENKENGSSCGFQFGSVGNYSGSSDATGSDAGAEAGRKKGSDRAYEPG